MIKKLFISGMQDEIAADNLNGLKSLDFQIQK